LAPVAATTAIDDVAGAVVGTDFCTVVVDEIDSPFSDVDSGSTSVSAGSAFSLAFPACHVTGQQTGTVQRGRRAYGFRRLAHVWEVFHFWGGVLRKKVRMAMV
jgi:hypothetical protein